MAIRTGNCPKCNVKFNVRETSIGTMRRCQACGHSFMLTAAPAGCASNILKLIGAASLIVVGSCCGLGLVSSFFSKGDPQTNIAPQTRQETSQTRQVGPQTPLQAEAPNDADAPNANDSPELARLKRELKELEKARVFSKDPKTGRPSAPPDEEGIARTREAIRQLGLANQPQIDISISDIVTDWSEKEQIFQIHASNKGALPLKAYLVVYAINDSINPPRRSAWPWGSGYVRLTGTKVGSLSKSDMEGIWARIPEAFRGEVVELAAGDSADIVGLHPLNASSLDKSWEGQRFAQVGFNQYQIWAFTQDGKCFYEKIVDHR